MPTPRKLSLSLGPRAPRGHLILAWYTGLLRARPTKTDVRQAPPHPVDSSDHSAAPR